MDEHTIRIMLEGGGGIGGQALRTALWLPGKLYGLAMLARRRGYAHGWLASHEATVPVISIGNLTAGGSGKTPLTALLANHLAAGGKKPAILLRGYRGGETGQSDEAVLYADLCPGVPVEVGSDRLAGARRAVSGGADVLLMDDGFQHRRLRRDLDIVLVDATSPWGGGNTLPGGLLREPLPTLARASVIVVTRSDQVDAPVLRRILDRIRRIAPESPLFTAHHRPARLRTLNGAPLSLDKLRGQKVVVLSGIARPEAFVKTLAQLGSEIIASFHGGDHRHFTREQVGQAAAAAAASTAVIVVTEKDQAKNINCVMTDNIQVDNTMVGELFWVLGIEQDVNGMSEFLALVDAVAHGEKRTGRPR